MYSIIMPKLGLTMENGTIVKWIAKEGDQIEKGDVLFEVETDKAVNEVHSPSTGTLAKIVCDEGVTVDVLTVIGFILEPGEESPKEWPKGFQIKAEVEYASPQMEIKTDIKATPIAIKIAKEKGIDLSNLKGTGDGGMIRKEDVISFLNQENITKVSTRDKVKISPRAKKLADQMSIDIDKIQGSGPGGRITEPDVKNHIGSKNIVKPSRLERITAERMTVSFTTVPHFYLRVEIDATELLEWRKKLLPIIFHSTGIRVTITDLLVLLVSRVLLLHPRVNATWTDEGISLIKEINIGIATAVDDGLIVPVISNADQKSLEQISNIRNNLTEKANRRELTVAELEGGTFTLTNLGMFDIDDFDAIINSPQSAILAVGKITERVIPAGNITVIKPIMRLSLAVDHRVLDGAIAARFLRDLKHYIESPDDHIASALFRYEDLFQLSKEKLQYGPKE
jgi:pyruvate dehydrogenase E2 component (dihydrolipoamide acetyltransferase)